MCKALRFWQTSLPTLDLIAVRPPRTLREDRTKPRRKASSTQRASSQSTCHVVFEVGRVRRVRDLIRRIHQRHHLAAPFEGDHHITGPETEVAHAAPAPDGAGRRDAADCRPHSAGAVANTTTSTVSTGGGVPGRTFIGRLSG